MVVATAFVPVNSFSSTVSCPSLGAKMPQLDSGRVSEVFSFSVEVAAFWLQPTTDPEGSGVSARITPVGANINAIRKNARAFDIFSGYQQLRELPTGRFRS